ncbi:GNAT family N-acetyltransferase [Nonomuraea sp. ZG12]|uniref:GNAT family N-acetyltransferase n=1 Tax=Nonomuraea sp. ZG12 TaxID=3452207 RepID=UPI003F8CE057
MVDTRRYAGPRDLRAMQELTSRIWSPESRWHVGDLAWGRFQHVGREAEWPTMLWHAGGRTLAWGWIELPGHLELAVDPGRPELADEVLGWFEETVRDADRSVVVSSSETHLVEALERRGYLRADGGPFFVHLSRDLQALPEIRLPAGYVARAVGDEDVPGRVLAHRAAFHPSRVSVESYSAVRVAWPYRRDLDRCVVAPDGSVAAYCLLWLDEAAGAARIEPVGTVPEHRGRGLAGAACSAGLRAARAAGAELAVVAPRGDDAYPVPARLYRGLGFQDRARSLHFHARAASDAQS